MSHEAAARFGRHRDAIRSCSHAAGATYADVPLVVLVWRVLSFWLPTLAGLAPPAALHRSRTAVATDRVSRSSQA